MIFTTKDQYNSKNLFWSEKRPKSSQMAKKKILRPDKKKKAKIELFGPQKANIPTLSLSSLYL